MSTDTLAMPRMLFLGDLQVGQRFESTTYMLNEARITRFAEEWHTAAITMRLIISGCRSAATSSVQVPRSKWPRATRPGDLLHAEMEIAEIRGSKSRPDWGTVKLHVTTRNQDGDAVQILDLAIVVAKWEAAA
jgi:acyl dehydratase